MKKPPKRKSKHHAGHKARGRRAVPAAQPVSARAAPRSSPRSSPRPRDALFKSTAAVASVRSRADDVFKLGLATLPVLVAAALLLPSDMKTLRRATVVATSVPAIDVTRSAPPAPLQLRVDRDMVVASAPVDVAAGERRSEQAVSVTPGAAMILNAALAPRELQAVQPATIVSAHAAGVPDDIGGTPVTIPASRLPLVTSQPSGPVIASVEIEAAALTATCSVDEVARSSSPLPGAAEAERGTLGLRIAEAARAQTAEFVVYSDRYFGLSYPMGDVPALYGVCTDVVVRALRAVGIDLQALVHEAKGGRGDASIDHRRTEALRRFFLSRGYGLPVTDHPEDYVPGDIVTYLRPQNPRVQSHIAVVSDVIGPSGRPMIVHNRGWGPQLEDALFADAISGHFRLGAGPIASPSGPVSTAPPASRSRPVRTTAKGRSAKAPPVF